MIEKVGIAWEGRELSVSERATLLAAWAAGRLCPSGGLFRLGPGGGFRTSGGSLPFLSHVLGFGEEPSAIIAETVRLHPDVAVALLRQLSEVARHGREAVQSGPGVGPVMAKQMRAALDRYAAGLTEAVQGAKKNFVSDIQRSPRLSLSELECTSITVQWLAECASIACDEAPEPTRLTSRSPVLVELLIESIRNAALSSQLRADPQHEDKEVPLAEPLVIATGEWDVGPEVISWAGADRLWYETGLSDELDALQDVLAYCDAAFVDDYPDEDGPPGGSFITYEVCATRPELLRRQITERLVELCLDRGIDPDEFVQSCDSPG